MKPNTFQQSKKNVFDFFDAQLPLSDLKSEVIAGLQKKQKAIPAKFFYDSRGSQLFSKICTLPEYYPTRTEISILKQFHRDIAEQVGAHAVIVEYGCGNSEKIKIILKSLAQPQSYIAIDIAKSAILELAQNLAEEYPQISIHAVCADFTDLDKVPYLEQTEKNRLAFFPGSSIGNFERPQAQDFLSRISKNIGKQAALLIGVDLKKDPDILNAAYNDSQGITAQFNKNLLRRINQECGANFNIEAFSHHAFYNAALGRIEMHLISSKKQSVQIENFSFSFKKDESIHTENSYKYSIEEFQQLSLDAGWKPIQHWKDPDSFFSLHYLNN